MIEKKNGFIFLPGTAAKISEISAVVRWPNKGGFLIYTTAGDCASIDDPDGTMLTEVVRVLKEGEPRE